jgi:ubiquinone/menaquinone biosynthesis C-methylase UbiE
MTQQSFGNGLVLAAALMSFASAPASAQLAGRPAGDWIKVLDAEDRVKGLKATEVVASLKVKPGDVIADLGAGAGPFVVPFATAVSPEGKVYAVEVDRDFFPHIEKRATAAGVTNVRTVLGAFTDPKLPAADVDLAFMHDVLHHVEDRAAYLKAAAAYLKPGARMAIIDYHPERSPHSGDASLQVSKAQTTAWMAAAGFTPVEDLALFADKWFLVFARTR